MEKLQKECKEYKLYAPDSLKYITDSMDSILIPKIEEYKALFGIDEYEQIQINYFDDLEKFRNFIYDLRGEKDSLPDYAIGTYDSGMINAFIPSNIVTESQQYKEKLYMASHELFHIMYKKLVLKGDSSKRIVWYDEGMAQFMSGEKKELQDISRFKEFYLYAKMTTKELPNLNNINHGNSFCNEYYNGYILSYLCIRYLSETLSSEDFKKLMRDFDKITEYGNTILNDMFGYYDNIFNNQRRI